MSENSSHAAQPSGSPSQPAPENTSASGPGPVAVTSNTPENDKGQINPSAPEDANTTPGSTTDK